MNEFEGSDGDSSLWYERGRLDAESREADTALLARLTGTAPVSRREYDRVVQLARQWQAECARLRGMNNQLAIQLDTSVDEYTKLKAWADACAARRDEWKQRFEEQKGVTFAMSRKVDDYWDELERYRKAGD